MEKDSVLSATTDPVDEVYAVEQDLAHLEAREAMALCLAFQPAFLTRVYQMCRVLPADLLQGKQVFPH
jgi:hypothetical protein